MEPLTHLCSLPEWSGPGFSRRALLQVAGCGAAWLTPLAELLARDTRQRGLDAGLDYQRALADLERAIGAPIR